MPEPSLEVVLVRHGQSEGNRDRVFTGHGPSRLTDLGRAQADATARALCDPPAGSGESRPFDAIYASDLPRAVETARPIALLAGLPIEETGALRERDVGDLTGLDFDEVRSRWPEAWPRLLSRDPDFRPGGGESHRMCRDRVGRFLDGLIAARRGRVVLVSHGVAMNHMLRHLAGVPADGASNVYFQVDNCSIHRVDLLGDIGAGATVRITRTNDVAHLAGLAPRVRG